MERYLLMHEFLKLFVNVYILNKAYVCIYTSNVVTCRYKDLSYVNVLLW